MRAARLGGTGVTGGSASTTGSPAILTVGASAGPLTFNENLGLTIGAFLEFDLGANTHPGVTRDPIVVNGTFTGSRAAGGLQFQFTSPPGFQIGVLYELIRWTLGSGLDCTDLMLTHGPVPQGWEMALDPEFGTGADRGLKRWRALFLQREPRSACAAMDASTACLRSKCGLRGPRLDLRPGLLELVGGRSTCATPPLRPRRTPPASTSSAQAPLRSRVTSIR